MARKKLEKAKDLTPVYPSDEDYLYVIEYAPLVSIDLIVRSRKNDLLMGLRRNRPAQGCWFVPGGAIKKNETVHMAFVLF